MSLYGIHRMLSSRDLGPSHILPTIAAFGSEEHRCDEVDAALDMLRRDAPDEPFRSAVDALRAALHDAEGRMANAFSTVAKLGARERLELERRVKPVGGEIQALRDLIEVVQGALHPRPARMTLSELLRGRWRTRPAFVAQTIELHVAAAHDQFEADPRVLWGLVERSLAQVAEAGVDPPFAALLTTPDGRVLELGDVSELPSSTIERAVVELGPVAAVADEVLTAVARHIGADACKSPRPSLRKISVAA